MRLGTTTKVAIGWSVVVVGGIYAFYLSKSSIDRRRYEHMKIRERIKHSNEGDYEPSSRKFAN